MTTPKPARLVPDDLIPAAKLITRVDNYSGGNRPFEQGQGPLCFGGAKHQARWLAGRAKDLSNLAAAYGDLAEWMASQVDAVHRVVCQHCNKLFTTDRADYAEWCCPTCGADE